MGSLVDKLHSRDMGLNMLWFLPLDENTNQNGTNTALNSEELCVFVCLLPLLGSICNGGVT